MISPVWGSTECPITQPYGCTDLTVEPYYPPCPSHHKHCGIDVAMAVGTQLFAARAGMVINITYGLVGVMVGQETDWYVHVDRAADQIRFGNPVAKGELLAYSGNKVPAGGVTTGPHLHFESQAGGLNNPYTSLDPIPILTGGYPVGTTGNTPDGYFYDMAYRLVRFLFANQTTPGPGETTPVPITAQDLLAAIKAVPAAQLQPVLDALNAQQAQLNAMSTTLSAMKQDVDTLVAKAAKYPG